MVDDERTERLLQARRTLIVVQKRREEMAEQGGPGTREVLIEHASEEVRRAVARARRARQQGQRAGTVESEEE